MQPRTLPDLWRHAAASFPSHPAILEDSRSWSFAEVGELSDRVAAGLAARGVRKGDRIALYSPNTAAFAIAYMGIVKAGGCVLSLHLLYHPNELAWILNDAGATGLLYLAPLEAAVDAITPQVPGLRHIVRIGGDPRPDHLCWTDLLDSDAPVPSPGIEPAEDLAALLYTSGTTGKPKGAMLTHRNLVSNTFSVRESMKLVPGEDRILVALPMFHAFAAMVGMLFPLGHGCTLIPLAKFEPTTVAEAIRRHKATVLPLVPSMFNVLLRLPDEFTAHLDSLRYCISGGAAMPVEILRQFEARFHKPIYEGDGPTECSPVTCVNPIGGISRPGSVGFPVANVEMRILDEQGQELPTGVIGEICVRAPSVMKGYWNQPGETAASFFGEWFRTGDLGHVDDDGYFYIVDRKKDMLIVNGMNVYPRVVEEVLYQHPAILEAAVIGVEHKTHGEIPEAWVVLHPGMQDQLPSLRPFCLQHLGRHEVPRHFHPVPSLPKNAAGKINKRELRKHGETERGIPTA